MLRTICEISLYGYSHDWLEPPSFLWSNDLRDPIWEEDPEWRGEDHIVGFRYKVPCPEPLQAGAYNLQWSRCPNSLDKRSMRARNGRLACEATSEYDIREGLATYRQEWP